MLAEATGVPADRQELKSGFPPRPLALPTDGTLADAGIQSGDSLTVTAGAPTAATVPAPAAAAAGAAAAPAAAGAGADHHLASVAHLTEDEQLARAIALSMGEAVPDLPPAPAAAPPAAAAPAPAAAVRAPAAAAAPPRRAASPVRAHPAGASSGGGVAAPTSVPLPGGGAVVRRVVDSDNSCLFNSVGYATERSRAKAAQLRCGQRAGRSLACLLRSRVGAAWSAAALPPCWPPGAAAPGPCPPWLAGHHACLPAAPGRPPADPPPAGRWWLTLCWRTRCSGARRCWASRPQSTAAGSRRALWGAFGGAASGTGPPLPAGTPPPPPLPDAALPAGAPGPRAGPAALGRRHRAGHPVGAPGQGDCGLRHPDHARGRVRAGRGVRRAAHGHLRRCACLLAPR